MKRDNRDRERGVTLVELIIGMGIGTVVAILAVYMLINTFTSQNAVTASTTASTRGHVISEVIDEAVRNATAISVTPDGTELDVRLNDGSCERFRASASKLERWTSTSPAWSDLASYAPVAFKVQPVGSASPSYFATPSPSAPPTVSYGFRLSNKSGSVDIASVVAPRAAVGSSPGCP